MRVFRVIGIMPLFFVFFVLSILDSSFAATGTSAPSGFRGVKNNTLTIPARKPIQIQFERANIANWTIASGSAIKLTRDGSVLTVIAGEDSSVFVKLVDETVYPLTFRVSAAESNFTGLYTVPDSADVEGGQEEEISEGAGSYLVLLEGEAYELLHAVYNRTGLGKYRIEQENKPAGKIAGLDVWSRVVYTSEHYIGIGYIIYNAGSDVVLADEDIVKFTRTDRIPVVHHIDGYSIPTEAHTLLIVIYRR